MVSVFEYYENGKLAMVFENYKGKKLEYGNGGMKKKN